MLWLLALLPILPGSLIERLSPTIASSGWTPGVSLLLIDVLVAADRNPPLPAVATSATVIGAFHGEEVG